MGRSSVSQRSTPQSPRALAPRSWPQRQQLLHNDDAASPSPAPGPASKLFESDERSKLLTPGPINNTSILRDMREPEIHTSVPVLSSSSSSPSSSPSSCTDCHFVDCEDVDCLAEIEPAIQLCTGSDSCPLTSYHLHDTCIDAVCEMEGGCDGGEACDGNFEEFLQCCTDYHSYLGSPQLDSPTSQINWDSWQDLLSAPPASFSIPSSPHASADPARSFAAAASPSQMMNPQNSFPNFQAQQQQNLVVSGFGPPPPTRIASPQNQRRVGPPLNAMGNPGRGGGGPLVCLWANCGASFSTMNELVGHVNLLHLRPASSPRSYSGSSSSSNRGGGNSNSNNNNNNNNSNANANALSCLWGNCQTFPGMPGFTGPFAGPSSAPSNPQFDAAALNMLSSHLMQDHLGLPVQPFSLHMQPPQAQTAAGPSTTGFGTLPLSPPGPGIVAPRMHASRSSTSQNNHRSQASAAAVASGMPSPKSTPSQTPEPSAGEDDDQQQHHDCASSAHICHWLSCGRSFPTCDALTTHITSSHVGSGRSHYDCYWAGCNRHGEQGFASKQKILRHLQSHTGHRPFQCQICQQNFSEAATLQQHMRRHTQEKPFVCDFPGCGKAFAITGALTIHKRTHNGDRPFKCPHCEKAFAESSNLSKHVRTHTGLRPYSCTEPGCDKCFARPDQLHRHMNVHTKKKAAQSSTSS